MLAQPPLLAKHAFVCQADEHLVFLDLKKDKYLCLGREHSISVQEMLMACSSIKDSVVRSKGLDRSEARVVQSLLESGLFVHDKASGKTAVFASTEPPSTGVMIHTHASPATVKFRHVSNFVRATMLASMRLRWSSIESIVQGVERRKRDVKCVVINPCTRVREHTAIFRALRRYYPRQYLCLFDSLALIEFLARYGIFPQWVFGVKMEPFGAHCWVQDGSTVLNDTAEFVRKFTPIMVV